MAKTNHIVINAARAMKFGHTLPMFIQLGHRHLEKEHQQLPAPLTTSSKVVEFNIPIDLVHLSVSGMLGDQDLTFLDDVEEVVLGYQLDE